MKKGSSIPKDENDTACHMDEPSSTQTKRRRHPKVKSTNRAWHRLHSIRYDVSHRVRPILDCIVQQYATALQPSSTTSPLPSSPAPSVTLFLNQRCGTWYWPWPLATSSRDSETDAIFCVPTSTCHFKSTDGHVGCWFFSLKRLNLQLIYQAAAASHPTKQQQLIVVLDASVTKAWPDSFSRTLPLWAAVLNRTAAYYRQQLGLIDDCRTPSPQLPDKARYFDLQTPPNVVSRTEHETMANLVEERVSALIQSHAIVEPHRLALALQAKPLTPFWISLAESHGDNTQTTTLQGFPTALDFAKCLPILCINASQSVHNHPKRKEWIPLAWQTSEGDPINDVGFWYTPGAGDDEESWARGLSPSLFWAHDAHLLDSKSSLDNPPEQPSVLSWIEDQIDARIDALVEEHKRREGATVGDAIAPSQGSHYFFDWLGSTGLALGSRRAGRPLDCWQHFQAVLNVTDTEYPEIVSSCQTGDVEEVTEEDEKMHDGGNNNGRNRYYLQLPVQEGKRDRIDLERWMAVGIYFCILHAQAGRRVLIHCAQGKDRSVAIALATTVLFCELRFPLDWKDSFRAFSLEHLWRQDTGETKSHSCIAENGANVAETFGVSGLPQQAVDALLGNPGRDLFLEQVRLHNNRHKDKAPSTSYLVDETTEPFPPLATKETLRIALQLIRQDREQAEPTRCTMQKLNRFFMSGAFQSAACLKSE